jgi:hypothetical protein
MVPMFSRKKSEATIDPEKFFKSIPIINSAIKYEEDEDGIITVIVPVPETIWIKYARTRTKIPEKKRIKLDRIGSKVWKRFDGKTTLGEIVKWMKGEFTITEREAELSLPLFVKNLMEKKFIALFVTSPKPGTAEAIAEINRLERELVDLEKSYHKRKIDESTYKGLKESYDKTIAELKGSRR